MPKKIFTLPRGMKDVDQEEMARRLWIFDCIREVTHRYGFYMVDPSTIEHLETLEAKSGPEIRDEIYHFKDKSGRGLGLRFDLTVGMTRMVAGRSDLPIPIKICAINGMWRYDEPQFARYRYFWQWDAEIYGVDNPSADAEIISLGIDILEEVNLREYEVLLNSRTLTEGLLEETGVSQKEKLEQLIRVIDKKNKVSEEEFIGQLKSYGIGDRIVDRIVDFTSIKGDPEKVITEIPKRREASNEKVKEGLDKLKRVIDHLKGLGKIPKCSIDLSIVRGIDYYDGVVFEAYDKYGEDIGAIFGGGRYDKLGRIYGKRELPATGVAGGIERLMISLERSQLYPQFPSKPLIYVVSVNDEVKVKSLEVVKRIRDVDVSCDFDLKGKSLKNQLSYIDSMKIPYAIIIGPREVKEGILRVKDMKDHKETQIALDNLEGWLNSIT